MENRQRKTGTTSKKTKASRRGWIKKEKGNTDKRE